MMTKMIKAVSLLLAASLLTGCSVTNTASGTPEASGGAVSGSVAAEEKEEASGGAVSESVTAEEGEDGELSDQCRNYLENSDNRYDVEYNDSDKDELSLFQYRLNGTQVKEIRMDIQEVKWVTDEWLYYSTGGETEEEILWRIPIRKTKKGDKLLTDRKEKLSSALSIDIDYLTDSYLILSCFDEEAYVCKYNCKTGEKTILFTVEIGLESCWSGEYPIIWEDNLFYCAEDELFRLNLETEEASSLYAFNAHRANNQYIADYAMAGNVLYLLARGDSELGNSELYGYDCISDRVECLVSAKELQKAVNDDREMGKLCGVNIEEIYVNQNRLYFFANEEWFRETDSESDGDYFNKNELFILSLDSTRELHHEHTLTDYLNEKDIVQEDYTGSKYFTSKIKGFIDGKMIVTYKTEDMDEFTIEHYVLYDLKTGEIQDILEDELPEQYEDLI